MAKRSQQTDIKTASVLAFERKLDPSDALFHAGQWSDIDADDTVWQPIAVREKSVRGTISNRLKGGETDPAKLDAQIDDPNLQRVDVATLPPDRDTLRVRFTLRVLGGAGTPSACNDPTYRDRLDDTVASYVQSQGFGQLAMRYAVNIANGRFLWRNRLASEVIKVRVRRLEQGAEVARWAFDAPSFSLRNFNVPPTAETAVAELADAIETGLAGTRFVLLEITAYARMGHGQEVYPSQELILDDSSRGRGKGTKSKTLYAVDGVAGMHSQKIGNALRTIDTWYPAADEGLGLGPISVEPYGSVTSQGRAYRQPREKADFYNLLDRWVLKGEAPAVEQQHYVMANLIRGGVFGANAKD
jgi:CRISPR-associated protein Csy3